MSKKIMAKTHNKKLLEFNAENLGYTWLLFFIAPVLAFIISVKNFKYKFLRKFIVLFGGLYGLFYIPIPNSDATRFQSYYAEHENYSLSQYLSDIFNVFSGDTLFPDIYAFTVFFIGNLFSSNPQLFHLITGLIYFFVFIKLIGCIYDLDYKILKRSYGWFFLGIVFITNFSSGINSVRWPLAVIVFLYGALNLITHNKVKYLFIASLSILVHFSLYPIVLVLALFYFIPFLRKINILGVLAIMALIAGALLKDLIFGNSDILGVVIEDKLADYTGEGYLEKRAASQSDWNFYVPILSFGNYFFAIAALCIMWFKQKKMITNQITNQLFGFAIFMVAISFAASSVVDLATNRYTIIVSFFTFVYLIHIGFLNKNAKVLKVLMYVYIPIILLRIFSMIRVDSETIGIEVLSNPIFTVLF
jgi:hypothetical protein